MLTTYQLSNFKLNKSNYCTYTLHFAYLHQSHNDPHIESCASLLLHLQCFCCPVARHTLALSRLHVFGKLHSTQNTCCLKIFVKKSLASYTAKNWMSTWIEMNWIHRFYGAIRFVLFSIKVFILAGFLSFSVGEEKLSVLYSM